jgi:uroporphyrinogen-III decarboxylase
MIVPGAKSAAEETSSRRPHNWAGLTPYEKRQWRFDRWKASAAEFAFARPEAEAAYKARMERMIAVYNVEEPDRVPAAPPSGLLPLQEAGLDYGTASYHPERAIAAIRAFNEKHAEELDSVASSSFTAIPARAFDILGLNAYAFPGHGMAPDGVGFQFVEAEYMRADEYDALIRDPSDFWLRTYLPRAHSVFEAFPRLASLTSIIEIHNLPLWPLARPEIQQALERLLEAGRELSRYLEITAGERAAAAEAGFPVAPVSGFATAPFDTIGDTLRGTRGILMDMLRDPDKLLEALDVVADLHIHNILSSQVGAEGMRVFFPLHKGADGWMSEKQFLTFYWPSLKKVMDALIAEGLLCTVFAEGAFNSRLELVNEFPKGAVSWRFDRSDMAKAKRVLGKTCSIEGNVPTSLLVAGSPEEVTEACRRLIDICAPGGGYILGSGGTPEFPRLENLVAMARAAREYGVYAS